MHIVRNRAFESRSSGKAEIGEGCSFTASSLHHNRTPYSEPAQQHKKGHQDPNALPGSSASRNGTCPVKPNDRIESPHGAPATERHTGHLHKKRVQKTPGTSQTGRTNPLRPQHPTLSQGRRGRHMVVRLAPIVAEVAAARQRAAQKAGAIARIARFRLRWKNRRADNRGRTRRHTKKRQRHLTAIQARHNPEQTPLLSQLRPCESLAYGRNPKPGFFAGLTGTYPNATKESSFFGALFSCARIFFVRDRKATTTGLPRKTGRRTRTQEAA